MFALFEEIMWWRVEANLWCEFGEGVEATKFIAIWWWRFDILDQRLSRLSRELHYWEVKVRMYVGRKEWVLMPKRCWGVWMMMLRMEVGSLQGFFFTSCIMV